MTGAELLALARHSRGSSEGDADTARHLIGALALLMASLKPSQSMAVHRLLLRMTREDVPLADFTNQ